jgi:hypothetical protein
VNLDNEIAQGNNAERVLTDVSPYFDMVEAAILDAWKKSPVADEKGQHELRLMLKLLGDLKANIKTAIDTGKLAKVQIERENLIDKAKNVVRRFA